MVRDGLEWRSLKRSSNLEEVLIIQLVDQELSNKAEAIKNQREAGGDTTSWMVNVQCGVWMEYEKYVARSKSWQQYCGDGEYGKHALEKIIFADVFAKMFGALEWPHDGPAFRSREGELNLKLRSMEEYQLLVVNYKVNKEAPFISQSVTR